jgi:hypothetical protein
MKESTMSPLIFIAIGALGGFLFGKSSTPAVAAKPKPTPLPAPGPTVNWPNQPPTDLTKYLPAPEVINTPPIVNSELNSGATQGATVMPRPGSVAEAEIFGVLEPRIRSEVVNAYRYGSDPQALQRLSSTLTPFYPAVASSLNSRARFLKAGK